MPCTVRDKVCWAMHPCKGAGTSLAHVYSVPPNSNSEALWALRWVITLLMQADGHCLYRAVGDQLGCQTTGAAGARDLWAIRAKAAAYMRAHPDQFIPFMPEAGSPLHTFWPLTALCSLF